MGIYWNQTSVYPVIFELIGWLGAVLFIISYFLLSKGVWKQNEKKYHLANLAGAICLIVNAIKFKDTANILVNIVWAGIALFAIYKSWGSLFRSKS